MNETEQLKEFISYYALCTIKGIRELCPEERHRWFERMQELCPQGLDASSVMDMLYK